MSMIVACSGKGSPGVTVTALALTLAWPRPVILAEADPAGGDIAAGYLRETPLGGRGMARLLPALHRGRFDTDLWDQLVDLTPGATTDLTRLVLPGFTTAGQAAAAAPAWTDLAAHLQDLAARQGYDLIVDCGRLAVGHPPLPLLARADAVLLVLRPTLPAAHAAVAALAVIAAARGERGGVGLVVVGDGRYRPGEVVDAIRHTIAAADRATPAAELAATLAVTAVLPDDPASAGVLSQGGHRHRGRLLRAAALAAAAVHALVRPDPPAGPDPAPEHAHAR